MPEKITGQVAYDDMRHFSYLIEGGNKSLLTIDVFPFNSVDRQDAIFAFDFLKQKGVPPTGTINILGNRKVINNSPIIVITQPF